MSKTYLEITYRSGKPFAAYLYLPRNPGDRSARTERRGKFLVDFSDSDRPIGVEFPSVSNIDTASVNQLLRDLHEKELTSADLAPLVAA